MGREHPKTRSNCTLLMGWLMFLRLHSDRDSSVPLVNPYCVRFGDWWAAMIHHQPHLVPLHADHFVFVLHRTSMGPCACAPVMVVGAAAFVISTAVDRRRPDVRGLLTPPPSVLFTTVSASAEPHVSVTHDPLSIVPNFGCAEVKALVKDFREHQLEGWARELCAVHRQGAMIRLGSPIRQAIYVVRVAAFNCSPLPVFAVPKMVGIRTRHQAKAI